MRQSPGTLGDIGFSEIPDLTDRERMEALTRMSGFAGKTLDVLLLDMQHAQKVREGPKK